MLRVLPLALAALYALVPSVCARIFSTFSCEEFATDDAGSTVAFLYSDNAVACGTAEHRNLTGVAGGLIVL